MSNLVEQFSRSYFTNRFAGAFFLSEDGTPAIIREAYTRDVSCSLCLGEVEAPKLADISIPHSFFKDMAQFDIPNMGWRVAGRGRFLAYMERTSNGYRRGTTRDNVAVGMSAISDALAASGTLNTQNYLREASVAKMLLTPKFTSFGEGIKDVASGRVVSFAVSHNMAVYAQDSDNMTIMLGKRKVGTVDYQGRTTFIYPSAERLVKELV